MVLRRNGSTSIFVSLVVFLYALLAIAQITTASTAARPVSRVVRGVAAGGGISPG